MKENFVNWLSRATLLARENQAYPHRRFGAILVSKGKPIAIAHNKLHSHPRLVPDSLLKKCSLHAEQAIVNQFHPTHRPIPYRSTLYLSRVGKLGQPLLAKPCDSCDATLRGRVKKVVYTISDREYGVLNL